MPADGFLKIGYRLFSLVGQQLHRAGPRRILPLMAAMEPENPQRTIEIHGKHLHQAVSCACLPESFPLLTGIFLHSACGRYFLGSRIVRTPFVYRAVIPSSSTSSGSETTRWKEPKERSIL